MHLYILIQHMTACYEEIIMKLHCLSSVVKLQDQL